MKTFKVNNVDFLVNIIYKPNNRRTYLRIKDGIIHITTPLKLSDFSISDMINNNFKAILKIMNETKKIEESIHFLGKKYNIILKENNYNLIAIKDKDFIINYTNNSNISKLVESFYNKELKKIVELYLPDILNKFNLKDVKVKYKNVKTYFGACFPKRKEIVFATMLAKYKISHILSVFYHECAHFKYVNHQKEFYDYLESFFPNYKNIQKEMRSIKYKDLY